MERFLIFFGELADRRGGARAAPQESIGNSSGDSGVDGQRLFSDQCASCRQPVGEGVNGQFPPLAGNRDLFLSRDYPALVILNGDQRFVRPPFAPDWDGAA